MTRFTVADEIFGPFNIELLIKNNELKRKWSGILRADLVFLDEIFKTNSAILNSLLSLMQERVVYDGVTGEEVRANLWTLIGASNEVPADEELQALYDRFSVRVFMRYLDDDAKLLSALMARWNSNIEVKPIATMNDVKTLHEYAVALLRHGKVKDVGEVLKLYHVTATPLIKTLRSKGVIISDRRIIEKFAELYAAYLALYGVTPENLMGAVYDVVVYAAQTPQEASEIKKAIDESLGEVAELSKKIEEGKALLRARNYQAALQTFKQVTLYDMSKLASKPWLKPRVEALMRVAQEYVKGTQDLIQQEKALLER